MGAGIALECRYRFRAMYERYVELCNRGELAPGKLFLWANSTPWILNFPTKRHWKDDSSLLIIRAGLEKFAATYRDKKISSIAFPRLGTSHGGLDWSQVRPLMHEVLAPLPNLRVEIFGFDPRAPDLLFPKLTALTARAEAASVARMFSLRAPQARAVLSAIEGGQVANMIALQRAPGVGDKTVERIYEVLCCSQLVSQAKQLELF